MRLQVLKFGGTSVASIDLMRKAADIVVDARKRCDGVVVVVSAMGDTTDKLLQRLQDACPNPTRRELDVIAHTGELVSSALFASVLQAKGWPSRSLSGARAGIRTNDTHGNARILDIDTAHLHRVMRQGEIPVVAGYQGANQDGEVTTLGRGGTDTTAAALGVYLAAEECRIYTDVRGVYTADPRICPDARLLPSVHFEEILELAALGAKVIHPRAVEFAGRNKLRLRILSTFEPDQDGTMIRFDEDQDMERTGKPEITGVTYNLEEAKLTLRDVPNQPGVAARLFSDIAQSGIDVDVIVQNTGSQGDNTDISFTVHRKQLERAREVAGRTAEALGCQSVEHTSGIAKVSVVGVGMRGHAGFAAQMFSRLAKAGINIMMISTSEIKVSVIIEEGKAKDAVRELEDEFRHEAHVEAGVVDAGLNS